MKFTDALAKLRSMTKGYCSMYYTLTVYDDGRMEPNCSVYTPEHSHTSPPKETWEAALQDLQDKMDGTKPRPLEGAPE